uniref:Uncharacterized protein n=1 Tax=Arundo donax TaxID=35708 RepID=A0A0A9D5X8_ARUDO
MLRSRSRRAVAAKQGGGLMAEPPATGAQSPRHPSSSSAAGGGSAFPSPRPFMAMALPQAGLLDGTEVPSSAMSPTSILETKQFCCPPTAAVLVGEEPQEGPHGRGRSGTCRRRPRRRPPGARGRQGRRRQGGVRVAAQNPGPLRQGG